MVDKKGPEMVIKRPFVIKIRFETVYTTFARFMFKVLVASITIIHLILVVSSKIRFTVFRSYVLFCFEFIGKLGNLMNNLCTVNVRSHNIY